MDLSKLWVENFNFVLHYNLSRNYSKIPISYNLSFCFPAADFSLGNVETTKPATPNETNLNTTATLKSGTRDKRGLDMEMPMFIIRPVENRKRIIIHDAPHSMMNAAQKPKVYSMGPHTGKPSHTEKIENCFFQRFSFQSSP
jgi:hypothetical protein